MKKLAGICSVCLCAVILAGSSLSGAEKKGKGKSESGREGGAQKTVERALDVAEAIFTEQDREVIHRYYSGGNNLPPGLAKKGKLPPGLEKQLRKNGSLPPGLQKRYNAQPLPEEVTVKLSRVPSGFSRILMAGKAIILNRENVVTDILSVVK